jgi:hypothetical protein
VIYCALQCNDCDGPKLAPDMFSCEDARSWPQEVLGCEYNERLARSSSAKLNGCHYAAGCHFSGKLPDTCLIINPEMTARGARSGSGSHLVITDRSVPAVIVDEGYTIPITPLRMRS